MNAVRLQYILIGSVIMMILSLIGAIWWLEILLKDQVRNTDRAKIEAEVSQLEVLKLKKLKVDLATMNDVIARTKQLAASSAQYQYQDQVIGDVNLYANRHGLGISSFDFATTPGGAKTATTGSRTAFTVALKSPALYTQFLKFIRDIEQNLTKMQVTSITLAPDSKNPSQITNPTIGLEVFIKQ